MDGWMDDENEKASPSFSRWWRWRQLPKRAHTDDNDDDDDDASTRTKGSNRPFIA